MPFKKGDRADVVFGMMAAPRTAGGQDENYLPIHIGFPKITPTFALPKIGRKGFEYHSNEVITKIKDKVCQRFNNWFVKGAER